MSCLPGVRGGLASCVRVPQRQDDAVVAQHRGACCSRTPQASAKWRGSFLIPLPAQRAQRSNDSTLMCARDFLQWNVVPQSPDKNRPARCQRPLGG